MEIHRKSISFSKIHSLSYFIENTDFIIFALENSAQNDEITKTPLISPSPTAKSPIIQSKVAPVFQNRFCLTTSFKKNICFSKNDISLSD